MKAFLCALLLLSVAAAVLAETCPEDIAPCLCHDDLGSHGEIDIECEGDKDEFRGLDLKSHLAQLRGKKIGALILFDIPFERLPTDLFAGLQVRRLAFQNCEMQALASKDDDLPFQGLEDTLEELSIDECFEGANQLKHLKLSHLKKLKEIFFYDNNVPEVPNDWFQDGPASLEEIYFVNCHVKSVGDKAFVALPNLEYITFSNNDISIVGRSMVAKPATKLKSIVVDGNRISSIPEDSFDDMPALDHIDFEHNEIRRLPAATWSRVWDQLEQLYLDGNPLECDSHMDWMFGRRRPHNLLATCESPKEREGKNLEDLIDEHEDKNKS